MYRFSGFAVLASLSLFAVPASASVESVVAGCSGGGNCVVLVQNELAGFRGTAAQKDRAIANIVSALANSANSSNGKSIAGAIAYAGSQSSSSGQQQQISQIANTISSGAGQTSTAAIGGQQGSAN